MTPSTAQVAIAALVAGDWDDVARIYADGIDAGVTFETRVPTWEEWDRAHLSGHRLLARDEGRAVGWAALAPVSSRCVYAGVAEVSVYVAAGARGRGVGTALLAALAGSSEAGGIWTLEAGILPENEARCTSGAASGSSAGGSGWAGCGASGATSSCWSGEARRWSR